MTVAVEDQALIHAKAMSQFFTTGKLARRIVEWAELFRGEKVLEPSAGGGDLVRAMPRNVRVTAVEMDPAMAEVLRKETLHPVIEVIEADFLKLRPARDAFDVAVMNPPYEDGADGRHVAHALRFAGRVVVLARTNFEYGTERFSQLFRWAQVTRRAVLTRRPKFYGPADQGQTARHDYVVLELVRREDRLLKPEPDQVETEFWTDSW